EFMSGNPLGFNSGVAQDAEKDLKAKVMGRLKEFMRPEFLNRIDDTVMFSRLDRAQLRSIVGQQLAASRKRLEAKGISLDVSADALDWLADKGYEPEFGAPPLRRVIQRELDDRIADLLVTEAVDEGGRIRAAVVDGGLRVAAETRPAPAGDAEPGAEDRNPPPRALRMSPLCPGSSPDSAADAGPLLRQRIVRAEEAVEDQPFTECPRGRRRQIDGGGQWDEESEDRGEEGHEAQRLHQPRQVRHGRGVRCGAR